MVCFLKLLMLLTVLIDRFREILSEVFERNL